MCMILLDTKNQLNLKSYHREDIGVSHVHDIKCKDVLVSSMARNSNSDICENEMTTSSQWIQITGHPVDRIMGKSILLTHKAEIDIPRARELGRGELGGGEWIIVATETHDSGGDA